VKRALRLRFTNRKSHEAEEFYMPRKEMTQAEFKRAFEKIKAEGWIKSTGRGDRGVGHTLETKLGLEEDNLAKPDLGFAELKARRQNSTALVTLFTFDRKAWIMDKKEVVETYGLEDDEGRQGLYFKLRHGGEVTQTGLKLFGNNESVSVIGHDEEVVAKWDLQELANKFVQKLPALVLVNAESKKDVGGESFKYTNATLFMNPTAELIRAQLLAGKVYVDLRMHDAITKVRNHGTAFRASEDALPLLFSGREEL
jgi:hypothetical protein